MTSRLSYAMNNRFGRALAETVDDIITVRARVNRICSALDSMQYGSPADWERVESEFGLAVGKGADFYALMSALRTKLNEIAGLELIDQGARS
jgi:hypothetical protein